MIYRIDVSTRPAADGHDPQGDAAAKQIAQFGVDVGAHARAARVFFIDTDEPRDRIEEAAGGCRRGRRSG